MVDVTASAGGKSAAKAGTDGTSAASKPAVEGVHSMPAGLVQEELHVPTDEKDVYAYYYINKVRWAIHTHYSIFLFIFYLFWD